MPEGIKKVFDFKINLATIGTLLLFLVGGLNHLQRQELRLQAAERTVQSLDLNREQQRVENQKLQVQIERMSVQLANIERQLERGR